MFKHIMVPVDLGAQTTVGRGLDAAADLANHYGADVTLVSVTGSGVLNAPHNKAEAEAAMAKVVDDFNAKTSGQTKGHNITSPDVPAELDSALMHAVDELGVDLVVVGSHVPGLMEYVFASHAGWLASHAKVSVFVVR